MGKGVSDTYRVRLPPLGENSWYQENQPDGPVE